jgi:hypothetical protein
MIASTKIASLVAITLASLTSVNGDFYLYDGAQTDSSGTIVTKARAVDDDARGNCDSIENSADFDGYDGESPYPWPVERFTTSDTLCGIALRFEKTGDNYNVFDDVQGNQVSTCVQGSGENVPCFWFFISGNYEEAYYCESDVCS